MTHLRKAELACDGCKTRLEIDPTIDDPFYSSFEQRESPWKDWLKVDDTHHLCPQCAKAYCDKKAEMERELKRMAGIKTIEFDV